MTSIRSFQQRLSRVLRRWQAKQYDAALSDVEELLQAWPGNAQLCILWANLVQLQEDPTRSLEEAKQMLQQAIELDKNSPAGAVELGYFLDAVEDNPQAASKAFAEGIRSARRLLIDGLLGQARALLQLDKREEAFKCLTEAQYLAPLHHPSEAGKASRPNASRIEDLLQELFPKRSA
jgi:tetratricopeptide (TPR) repeat protein